MIFNAAAQFQQFLLQKAIEGVSCVCACACLHVCVYYLGSTVGQYMVNSSTVSVLQICDRLILSALQHYM